jgi:hypothetical protein
MEVPRLGIFCYLSIIRHYSTGGNAETVAVELIEEIEKLEVPDLLRVFLQARRDAYGCIFQHSLPLQKTRLCNMPGCVSTVRLDGNKACYWLDPRKSFRPERHIVFKIHIYCHHCHRKFHSECKDYLEMHLQHQYLDLTDTRKKLVVPGVKRKSDEI